MRYVYGFVKKSRASGGGSGQPPTDGGAPQRCGVEIRLQEYPRRSTFQKEDLEVQLVPARWREPRSLRVYRRRQRWPLPFPHLPAAGDVREAQIQRGSEASTE